MICAFFFFRTDYDIPNGSGIVEVGGHECTMVSPNGPMTYYYQDVGEAASSKDTKGVYHGKYFNLYTIIDILIHFPAIITFQS